jgi:hypothetical protein
MPYKCISIVGANVKEGQSIAGLPSKFAKVEYFRELHFVYQDQFAVCRCLEVEIPGVYQVTLG